MSKFTIVHEWLVDNVRLVDYIIKEIKEGRRDHKGQNEGNEIKREGLWVTKNFE